MQIGQKVSGKFLNISKEQTSLVYYENKVDESGLFQGEELQVAFIKLAGGVDATDALESSKELQFEVFENIEDREDLFKLRVVN